MLSSSRNGPLGIIQTVQEPRGVNKPYGFNGWFTANEHEGDVVEHKL